MSNQVSEAASLAPPSDGTREEHVRFYRLLLATPHTHQNFADLRRQGRDGLTMLGATPATTALCRRKLWLVSSHFRAKPPKGRPTR
ncbi:MAG: hypothetical protein Q8M31_01010 [Beijerinckiaceae bacterium]|nr:hypothetical protein [Beijerinckiaceae bacterium]